MIGAKQNVVIVTGASSGIGLACCEFLSRQGHRVYGTSRRADFAPEHFVAVAMDVTSGASVARGVASVLEREGRVDVLVNNAGYGLAGAVEDTDIDEAHDQLETNFFGAMRVAQAVLPCMRSRATGLIVNVSSIGGIMGLPFQGLYSASKFALEGLTESLRQEVTRFGIRVVLVEPGDVRTGITRNRVIARVARDQSPYRDEFVRALAVIERQENKGPPPEVVARLVERLIHIRAPKVRYRAGSISQRLSVFAKSVMPSRIFERGIMSYYGL